MPIELFIDAQEKGYSSQLRLFLLLKLLYPDAKARLCKQELQFIEFVEEYGDRRTLERHLNQLRELNFIGYNAKTGYHYFKAFDRLRMENDWNVRLAFPVTIHNYEKIKAITGAVIFGYLHRDFWRWVKREKSVQLKGCAYHFLSPKFNYKNEPAPVSVLGVGKIFNISPATASRLKSFAQQEGLLSVHKNYLEFGGNRHIVMEYCTHIGVNPHAVFHKGKYRLQLIDTICPLFVFIKRKSLKT